MSPGSAKMKEPLSASSKKSHGKGKTQLTMMQQSALMMNQQQSEKQSHGRNMAIKEQPSDAHAASSQDQLGSEVASMGQEQISLSKKQMRTEMKLL